MGWRDVQIYSREEMNSCRAEIRRLRNVVREMQTKETDFLEAVDVVCANCDYLSEDTCSNCPVRKTCINKDSKKPDLETDLKGGGQVMNSIVEQIIKDSIESNKENFKYTQDTYEEGYSAGYNDALVDLLNALHIEHNYDIIND